MHLLSKFVGTADKSKAIIDTDSSGTTSLKIKGLNAGKVIVITTTRVAGVELTNNLLIKIVQ